MGQSRNEDILESMIAGTEYTKVPRSREEQLLIDLKDAIEGSGGTTNYESLSNKPKINNVELNGNKSLDDIGVTSAIQTEVARIVADAPEDFDTLKEMSDWIATHEDDAAAMNSAILQNASDISDLEDTKVDKVSGKGLSANDYTTAEKTKLAGLSNYDDSQVRADIEALEGSRYTKAETDALLNEKQDTLTSAQLAAVDSGITAAKATQYDNIYSVVNYNALNHNGIFRGKNLTNVYTVDEMYARIHNGTFEDLYLGDYFTKSITTDIYTKFGGTEFESGVTYYERSGADLNNWTYAETEDAEYDSTKTYYTKLTKTENVTLMFAAFDYYYQMGDTACTTHHAILIPRNYGFAIAAKMNLTNTTVGAYYNSEIHQTTLPCYAKSLKTALNNHLLSHKTMLSNTINDSTPSMAGAGFTGASTDCVWATTELQLMTEQQLYGSRTWTSSAYDIGIDYAKLPAFNFVNPVSFGRNYFWLRSVVSSTNFAFCTNHGDPNNYGASGAAFVRPLILFG